MTTSDTHRVIDAVWRIESAKLIASLARIVGDVSLAEDLAQDALVIALERWPESGIPNRPGTWLMATAKHRAIDRLRRNISLDHKYQELGHELQMQQATTEVEFDAALYDALAQLKPSPIVELNRAVAVLMAYGPGAGLELVDSLTSEPSLKKYHLLPGVRGDLLAKLGRLDEARSEFERAATGSMIDLASRGRSCPPS